MGHVFVKVRLSHPLDGVGPEMNALVDTGATRSVIPKATAEKLKLPSISTKKVRTARGEVDLVESYLIIDLAGERSGTPVLISEELDQVLIGVLTLEALALEVDPGTGKLEKGELLLY